MCTFKPGDTVVWSPSALADRALKREHDGPFTVTRVREVPSTFVCGASLDDQQHRNHGCPNKQIREDWDCKNKPMRTQVGHHQWLVVRPASGGDPLQAPISGGQQEFSGKWFAPAPA